MNTQNNNEWEMIRARIVEGIIKDEQIRKLAEILVEGFIWQHQHKDKAPEPYVPKARKKKAKDTQGFHPGQTFYL